MMRPLYCPECGARWPVRRIEAHFEQTRESVQRNEFLYVVTAQVARVCPNCRQSDRRPVIAALRGRVGRRSPG